MNFQQIFSPIQKQNWFIYNRDKKMNPYNFMTFSIDQKIHSIEHFSSCIIFLSTARKILLYDLSDSSTITCCLHQPMRNKVLIKENDRQSEQDKSKNQHQLSPLEMHYFPSQKVQKCQQSPTNKQGKILLGHLMVHYKLCGISVYNVEQTIEQQSNSFTKDNSKQSIAISFNNFMAMSFGSAFLKFSFDQQVYNQKSSSNKQQINQLIFLSKEGSFHRDQLERRIDSLNSWVDFRLQRKQKSTSFYILTNENQIYEIKKLNLYDGKLQVLQSYQLDEESAQLNSSTVTEIKYIQFNPNSQTRNSLKYLILAMEGGKIYSYQLPVQKNNQSKQPNQQYYLQPFKVIDLKQHIHSKPNSEQVDYSVSSISLLDQGLGLVVVRKSGILLMDFRNFKVVQQISTQLNNTKIYKQKPNQQIVVNQSRKQTLFFADTRGILKIHSDLTVKQMESSPQLNNQTIKSKENENENENENESKNKNKNENENEKTQGISKELQKTFKISTTFVTSTLSSLRKLFIQIQLRKSLNSNKETPIQNIFKQQIDVRKIRCCTIQQLNTTMIEGIKAVINSQGKSQPSLVPGQQDANQVQVEIFGHYKQGKLFYFTL